MKNLWAVIGLCIVAIILIILLFQFQNQQLAADEAQSKMAETINSLEDMGSALDLLRIIGKGDTQRRNDPSTKETPVPAETPMESSANEAENNSDTATEIATEPTPSQAPTPTPYVPTAANTPVAVRPYEPYPSQPGSNDDNTEGETGGEPEEEPTESEAPAETTTMPTETPSGDEPSATEAPSETIEPEPTEDHTHHWVTETIRHEAEGHYETETETRNIFIGQVWVVDQEGYQEPETQVYTCSCGAQFSSYDGWQAHNNAWLEAGGYEATGRDCSSYSSTTVGGEWHDEVGHYEDEYETQEIVVSEFWVVDQPAWDETITRCSICGATQ